MVCVGALKHGRQTFRNEREVVFVQDVRPYSLESRASFIAKAACHPGTEIFVGASSFKDVLSMETGWN